MCARHLILSSCLLCCTPGSKGCEILEVGNMMTHDDNPRLTGESPSQPHDVFPHRFHFKRLHIVMNDGIFWEMPLRHSRCDHSTAVGWLSHLGKCDSEQTSNRLGKTENSANALASTNLTTTFAAIGLVARPCMMHPETETHTEPSQALAPRCQRRGLPQDIASPESMVLNIVGLNYVTSCDPHHDIYTCSYWQIFWHSIWHIFWHSIWHSIWHIFWHIFWHSIWQIFWHSIWHIFWHSIWHIFWHSIWHSIWHIFWYMFWNIFWHSIWHSIWYIF